MSGNPAMVCVPVPPFDIHAPFLFPPLPPVIDNTPDALWKVSAWFPVPLLMLAQSAAMGTARHSGSHAQPCYTYCALCDVPPVPPPPASTPYATDALMVFPPLPP